MFASRFKTYWMSFLSNRATEALNTLDLQIDGRSIESKDISSIIKSRPHPNDLLHKYVRRLYLKKICIRSNSIEKT